MSSTRPRSRRPTRIHHAGQLSPVLLKRLSAEIRYPLTRYISGPADASRVIPVVEVATEALPVIAREPHPADHGIERTASRTRAATTAKFRGLWGTDGPLPDSVPLKVVGRKHASPLPKPKNATYGGRSIAVPACPRRRPAWVPSQADGRPLRDNRRQHQKNQNGFKPARHTRQTTATAASARRLPSADRTREIQREAELRLSGGDPLECLTPHKDGRRR